MIRISTTRSGSRTIIRIAGRLDESHVAELEAHYRAAGEAPILDLAELRSADCVGVRWLVERGEQITGASPYIRLLLERAATCEGNSA